MKNFLLKIDKLIGLPFTGFHESLKFKKRERYFNKMKKNRIKKYPNYNFNIISKINEIEKNGFIIIKNFIDFNSLIDIRTKFDHYLDCGENLLPVSKDSARDKNDLNPSSVYLTSVELRRGQSFCRNFTNNMALGNPLLNIPEITQIAFNSEILDIASSYIGAPAALGGLNLRKSFVNDISEFDTQYFHIDPNSHKFLKVFFYLNNVDLNGGPFCYVRGSHKKRFKGYTKKYRWNLDEILLNYNENDIINITANLGDVIIADTNGFHRGNPISSNDRYMLTLDYVIHPEFDGKSKAFKIYKNEFDLIPENYKSAADYLEIV